MFIEYPDLANMTGTYPKVDSSHGFPHTNTYEMYRDWQENTLNSDGAFSMYIYLLCGIYVTHTFYSYVVPWYWISTPLKNDEETRLRMKDAVSTIVMEETVGN
jgi:hypothetical protein